MSERRLLKVDTEGTIHLLQDNLCDRYKDSFAIVQELLQNADDAKAKHVYFGLSQGLHAKCALLKCPALVVVNDGPVSSSDLDAIFRVAAGNKQDDENKIGKFGLGMKSVFHVCEGFFMFGQRLESQSELPCFCTPWSDEYHESWWTDWDAERDSAYEQVSQQLSAIAKDWSQWFCVWIPLRQESQLEGISPILKKFPNDVQKSALVGVETSEQASKMLPLLKNVEELIFADSEQKSRTYTLTATSRLGLKDVDFTGVVVAHGEGTMGYSFDCTARLYREEQEFKELQALSCWPETTHKESLRGSVAKKVADKTKPHAAICVLVEKSDTPRLTLAPCVFLPLSGPQDKKEYYSLPLPEGSDSVTVYMHGSMFVDAGRQDFSVGTAVYDASHIDDETALRKEWNRRLWEKAILPLLVRQLYKSLKGNAVTLAAVVEKFSQVTFSRTWVVKAFCKECIAKVLSRDGYVWACVPASHVLYAPGAFADFVTRELLCDVLEGECVSLVESQRTVLSGKDFIPTELPESVKLRILDAAAAQVVDVSRSAETLDFILKCASGIDLGRTSELVQSAKLWRHDGELCSYSELINLVRQNKVYSGCVDVVLREHFCHSVEWQLSHLDSDVDRRLHLRAKPFDGAFVIDILMACPGLKADIEARALLLKDLLQSNMDRNTSWRKVCRYLVHGQVKLFDNDEQIFLPIKGNDRFSSLIISTLAEQRFGTQCSVNGEIVNKLSSDDFLAIGFSASTPAELIIALGEVADRASFGKFPEGSWKKLIMLSSMDEPGVRDALLKIPLFPTVKGDLVALGDTCYWEDTYKIHPVLRDRVNVLVTLGTDTASKRVRQLAQKWTDQTCYKQCRGLSQKDMAVVLSDLLENNQTLAKDTYKYLQETRWVELTSGEVVAPSEIVSIPGITGLVPGLFYLEDVKDKRVASLVTDRQLFPGQTDSLLLVFDFLKMDGRFKIGRLEGVKSSADKLSAETLRTVLRNRDVMPVLNVLKGLDAQKLDYSRFLARLCGEISGDRLVSIINDLTERLASGGNISLLWSYLQDYLEEASDNPDFVDEILPRIRFVSEKNLLKEPSQLCTGGFSIPGEYTIHRRYLQSEKLRSTFIEHAARSRRSDEHERELTFKEYFANWDSSLERQIGTFIICCSNLPDDIALAKERYGYEHLDIEDARRSICDWLNSAMKEQQIKFSAVASNAINAIAIDGSDLPIKLSGLDAADDLFYGQFNPHEVEYIQTMRGRERVITRWLKLSMRMPDKNELDELGTARLSNLLKKSTEAVLAEYGKRGTNGGCPQGFYRYWDKLSNGEQSEIAPTKAMILENAIGYLPSIGCKAPELKDIFNRWHNLFVAEAQASDNNDQERVLKHDQEKKRIRRELEQAILGSPELQRHILESVRRKIRKGYSYSEQSILFELFQNADDAAEELRVLYGDASPEFSDRFVVKYSGGLLVVAHWGRMINQEKAGCGTGRRSDGFKRDLLKMLLVSQSDKDQDEINVVGRFGLGFKTIHFVTEAPVIFSGNIRFKVVGGYLPEALSADEDRQYKHLRDEIEGDEKRFPATIFCLPIVSDKKEVVGEVLDVFKHYAELLTLFSRRIKALDIKSETGAVSVVRKETPLRVGSGVFVCGSSNQYAVFRLKHADLLIGWKNGRFEALPDDVPTIWATAPTRVKAGLGIAVNANFDLDTGRGVLNDNSPDNTRLAESIAAELYDELLKLYHAYDKTERYALFESLYRVLTGKDRRENWKGDSAHSLSECLRIVFWRKSVGAYWRLVHDIPVVPSYLEGDLECLCRISDIEHMVEDRIATSELKRLVPAGKFKPGTVALFDLYRVGQINFPDDVRHLPQYKVKDLLDDLRAETNVATPEWCAGDGARILMENIDKESDLELESLRQFDFRTQAGTWKRCDSLLLDDEHDHYKAAFMPDEYLLSKEYNEQGICFVRLCRGERRIKTELLVAQMVSVEQYAKQLAVLKFLANGDPSEEIKNALREARDSTNWIANWIQSKAAKGLTNSERDAVARVLAVDEDDYDSTMRAVYSQPSFPWPNQTDESNAVLNYRLPSLCDVLKWWLIHRREAIAKYNQEAYGRTDVAALSFDRESLESRQEWMEVLLLGAAHRMGFKLCQHKRFIKMLKDKDWWMVYCQRGVTPQAWMKTLDEYLENEETNGGQYSYWFRLFIRIYQFSRHLDTYIQLFESLNDSDRLEKIDLAAIKTNSKLSGSGIDAPGLQYALGDSTGLAFVYREMVRRGAVENKFIHRFCFVPYPKVSEFSFCYRSSEEIYDRAVRELGQNDATFGLAFDIAITSYLKSGRK